MNTSRLDKTMLVLEAKQRKEERKVAKYYILLVYTSI